MHVLILPSWYFPADTQELPGRMFHHVAGALREEQMDARIFYAALHPKYIFQKSYSFKAEEGVPTWRTSGWTFPKINKAAFKLWRKKYVNALYAYITSEGKPDLIHAQSYMAGYICAQLKKETGIRYIVSERLSAFQQNTIPASHHHLIKESFDNASYITAVSPGLAGLLKKFSDRHVEVVPNFYDSRIFYVDGSISKNPVFTYVTAGEPAHVKGLDILITAFTIFMQKWPAIRARLVLADHIRERKQLTQLLETAEQLDAVIWTGLLSREELAILFRDSHVMISSSRVETFGKAIVEAQACGLPVIATPTEGAKFILGESHQGIMLKTHEPEEMADAMYELYQNYERYLSQEISATVQERFEKDIVIRTWKNLYQQVLS